MNARRYPGVKAKTENRKQYNGGGKGSIVELGSAFWHRLTTNPLLLLTAVITEPCLSSQTIIKAVPLENVSGN